MLRFGRVRRASCPAAFASKACEKAAGGVPRLVSAIPERSHPVQTRALAFALILRSAFIQRSPCDQTVLL